MGTTCIVVSFAFWTAGRPVGLVGLRRVVASSRLFVVVVPRSDGRRKDDSTQLAAIDAIMPTSKMKIPIEMDAIAKIKEAIRASIH